MKAKVFSFFIVSIGVFLILYFVETEADLTQRVLFSVLSGLVFSLGGFFKTSSPLHLEQVNKGSKAVTLSKKIPVVT